MKNNRLSMIDPIFNQSLSSLNSDKQQILATTVCQTALDISGLIHPITERALELLHQKDFSDPLILEDCQKLTEALDQKYFDVHEAKCGHASHHCEFEFKQARASATVEFAIKFRINQDVTELAEAIYEANAVAKTWKSLLNTLTLSLKED